MGPRAAALALAALCAACGDPVVILGDLPSILRIIAGVPDEPGGTLDSLATASRLDSPRGLAAAADEVAYISDHRNGRVLALQPSGRLESLIDSAAEPRLVRPDGLGLDGDGGLLIADPEGHRLWRLRLDDRSAVPLAGTGTLGFAPDGTLAVDAELGGPTGVVAETGGRIYFSERFNQRVRAIEPDGTLTTIAGTGETGYAGDGGPATDARLTSPMGLALGDGVLYVADAGNHVVRAVNLATGVITTVAGTGIAAFDGDGGPATAAFFDRPQALALSPDGRTLFIADTNNHRVRLLELRSGFIFTYAGTGEDTFNGDLRQAGATALARPGGLAVSPAGVLYLADTGHHVVRRGSVRLIVVAR